MPKITEYSRVSKLLENNVILIDGPGGTRTITAKDIASELLKLLDSKQQVSNLKMDELDQITSMLPTDKVLVGTETGVKAMSAKSALFEVLDIDSTISLPMRKNYFRGENLGSTFTADQKKEIRDGTFRGLFPGDYWEKDGFKWRIVDINYYKGMWAGQNGEETNTTNHLVIMPDKVLNERPLFSSPTTKALYTDSDWFSDKLGDKTACWNRIYEMFGASGVAYGSSWHSNYSGYSDEGGVVTNTMNDNEYLFVPTVMQILGTIPRYGDLLNTQIVLNADERQFDLYRIDPKFAIELVEYPYSNNIDSYFLRDVGFFTASNTKFYCITARIGIDFTICDNNRTGIRPAFCLTGEIS